MGALSEAWKDYKASYKHACCDRIACTLIDHARERVRYLVQETREERRIDFERERQTAQEILRAEMDYDERRNKGRQEG